VWTGRDIREALDRHLNSLTTRDGHVAAGYVVLIDPQFEKHAILLRAFIFKASRR
jgi:hypothetical protein